MKTEIRGYKLILKEYEQAFLQLITATGDVKVMAKVMENNLKKYGYHISVNSYSHGMIEKAGVMHWFEEIHKISSYSVGDYFYCTENFYMTYDKTTPIFVKGKVYKSEVEKCITNEKGNKQHQMPTGREKYIDSSFDDYFRFATEKEIEDLCKKETILTLGDTHVIITKNKILAEGMEWDPYQLLGVLSCIENAESTLNGYKVEFPNIKIGCRIFTKEDIKKVLDVYSNM